MGSITIDRTGEKNYNNFGSEMIIVDYRNAMDIDVYFPQYDWIARDKQYSNFKKGNISCPYERSTFGVGYIGEGKYKVKENGKNTRVYDTWRGMLRRCYDKEFHKKNPTYIDCEVDEDWLNFQNYGKWYDENFYEVEGERMALDKDILNKGNKIYSPNNCIFVPQTINLLFVKRQNDRGESAIGTTLHQGKYVVHCNIINPETGKSKGENLGRYDTQEKAFQVYKEFKEKNIKEVADYYKIHIPQKLYDGMYKYEVEITD